MELEFLRKIGLSQGEIKIYSSLLESGASPINKIHEKVGIERRNIYDIINKLIERGLVSYTNENKRRVFQISHPGSILGYIEEKKHSLEEIKKEAEKSMGYITEQFNAKRPQINGEVFRGKEGIKAIWEDMLNYKETLWIGSGRYVAKQMPHFFAGWNLRRINLKVKWINILRSEMRKEVKAPMPYEVMRFLPKEFSANPMVIAVYGNKVVNFLFTEEIFAFVIESKSVAENYKKYHKYLWDNVAKK